MRFGPGGRFELRPAEYRLLIDGEAATLGGRALDLLMALAARPAELQTKSALLDSVWPGLVVEEGNLRVQINALRRVLGEDAIATVPGRGYRFSAVLAASPAVAAAQGTAVAAATPAVAPAVAAEAVIRAAAPRLFGRDADLARVETALAVAGGCVTLVGMSGVGKSSLARLVLARWAGSGVWVDLAALTQASQLGGAIARALGGQLDDGDPSAQVLRLIPPEPPLLLVLDNAEHLIDGCAGWVARLQAAPHVQLLLTSQLPLAVAGERVLRLAPLHVAEGVEGPDPREGAVALLIDRIAAADSRFQVKRAALPVLASLCRQLDGLPLALEMAAARVPLMGLQAVHDALAERFQLLGRGRRDAPGRHRSLDAALGWSYGLLSDPEQRLFRALGVFAGGFTLDLAVAVAADARLARWDVVDGLASLVERSLVSVNGEDPPRYRLLETIRAYALEKLAAPSVDAATGAQDEQDERTAMRRRHAEAVTSLIAGSTSAVPWLADMENVREAFSWARQHDLGMAAHLSARAARTITFTVWRQEVTDWMLSLQAAMAQQAGHALPPPTQAHWWTMLAYLLGIREEPAALPVARQAVALWRPLGNATELQVALVIWVRAINEPGAELDEACDGLRQTLAADPSPASRMRANGALAVAARRRGDREELLDCNEQELRAALELGHHGHAQAAENNICVTLLRLGRHAEAAARAESLLQQVDGDGMETNGNLPWVLNVLVEARVALGRTSEAAALVPGLLAACRRFDTTVGWQGILVLAVAQNRFESAARLAGYVRRQWEAGGDRLDEDRRDYLQRATAAVHARLGAEAAAALAAEGSGLNAEAAASLALRAVE